VNFKSQLTVKFKSNLNQKFKSNLNQKEEMKSSSGSKKEREVFFRRNKTEILLGLSIDEAKKRR